MNIAIILSGGVGSRIRLNIPKQYMKVGGKPIINYCLDTFLQSKIIDAVVIGCADEWKDYVARIVNNLKPTKPVYYAQSGETRQYSIFNALKVAKRYSNGKDDIVIIHDSARPLVSNELINRCIDGCNEADGVMPVIAVKDTIYQSVDGKRIMALLDRSELWNGQAPEVFKLSKYLAIHELMSRQELLGISGSTEIAFKAGLKCRMIDGDPMNFKITTLEDLNNFKSIISNRESI